MRQNYTGDGIQGCFGDALRLNIFYNHYSVLSWTSRIGQEAFEHVRWPAKGVLLSYLKGVKGEHNKTIKQ